MPSTSASTSTAASTSLADPPLTGRLAILTSFVMAANALPIPIVPDLIMVRIRGAMAHDTASRHGLSLTAEARAMLADVGTSRALVWKAGEAVARQILRRVGPLGVVNVLTCGIEAYALGLLLDRYIDRVRAPRSVRIDADEARRLREVIDRAVLRAFSPTLAPMPTTLRRATEDLRSEATRWIDAVILTGASLPGYVDRRLEAAFDEIAADTPGLADG